jgi:hypothetical protein
MIRKAKGGDVQMSLLIAETIGFEIQMDDPEEGTKTQQRQGAAEQSGDNDEGDGDGDFDFM